MARLARGEYLDPNAVQVVHVTSRCVRQAFLCGFDLHSRRSYEHRRQWIRDRLEFLASIFGVDCLTYSIMNNHIHLVLRSRPDVVETWSREEIARRWLKLCPQRKTADGQPAKPTDAELNSIVNDSRRVAELRRRLSDISWWMGRLCEKIARQANREDQCTGRFWEGRYKAQLLLDEASLLACAVYVDLNPIRAALAKTPETSNYTGAKDRIDDLVLAGKPKRGPKKGKASRASRLTRWERSRRRKKSGWMSPLEIDERTDPIGAAASHSGRRASLKGFLSIPLTRYLELLDWTGRQLRSGKRGSIPATLSPILSRLGIETKRWCELVSRFSRLFRRAAGTSVSIHREAKRRGQNWLHAPGLAYLT